MMESEIYTASDSRNAGGGKGGNLLSVCFVCSLYVSSVPSFWRRYDNQYNTIQSIDRDNPCVHTSMGRVMEYLHVLFQTMDHARTHSVD